MRGGRGYRAKAATPRQNKGRTVDRYELTAGDGRTRVSLLAQNLGRDIVVSIYNENAHIGAGAVGEYDDGKGRASTSIITRSGHKDDAIALKAAYLISRHTGRPSCVVAGVHVDNITGEEIQQILEHAEALVRDFLARWRQVQKSQPGNDSAIRLAADGGSRPP